MPEATIEDLLAGCSPEVRDLALRTCDLARRILPGAVEKAHTGWKIITFGKSAGMNAMVFGVAPHRERVNIQLVGADLPDPTGLLEGTGKAARHVKIKSAEMLDDPALHDLLRAAVAASTKSWSERAAEAGPPVDGYRAYGSKTVNVSADVLSAVWTDDMVRARWLPEPLEIRGSTPGKSVRARWADGTTVDVRFTAKGEAKSSVAVDHMKIGTEEEAARLKAIWKDRLDQMKRVLEG
ncbi:MAG TPA: DUF1801 domain-containing protein [Longimicrobiaceae bacterium]|jgi:hypothetical protein|nr:DUF1801 domain-containing protein [Longimicrobiaceae bacterium]